MHALEMPQQFSRAGIQRQQAVGIAIVAGAVIAGILVGRYADSYFGTEPWLMIVGVVGGMAGAIYRLILVLQQLSRRGHNDRKD